jgi:hypothetical protein
MSSLILTSEALAGSPSVGQIEYNGQFYGTDSNSSRAQMQRIVLGTVNAGGTNPFPASGGPTAVNFTDVPAWANRVTVILSGVSTNGSGLLQILLGTGSTPTYATSGYIGGIGNRSGENYFSTGFLLNIVASYTGANYNGVIPFCNVTGNTWSTSFVIGANTITAPLFGAGSNALGAALTAVRITANGTDQFKAGSINILYEG